MNEKKPITSEVGPSFEEIVQVEKKPSFFRRVLNTVKEVPRVVGKIIRGVDKAIMHIPVAGEIYGAAKGITGEVWRATEQVPFLGGVTRGLREGAQGIHDAVGFTQPEKKEVAVAENELLGALRNIRNNLAQQLPEGEMKDDLVGFYDELLSRKDITPEEVQTLMNGIIEKHPELKPVIQKMMDQIPKFKTGREGMAPDKLVEEGRKLEQKIIDILDQDKGDKKLGEIDVKDFNALKQTFPGLPDYNSISKDSPFYNFLQNTYFSREPRPDSSNPLVKTFIEKTVTLFQTSDESFGDVLKDRNEFVFNNKDELTTAFHLTEFESTLLERHLNIEEKFKRLPPTLPHEYSGADYGLNKAHDLMYQHMFPDSSAGSREIEQKIENYQGVHLDFFVGGGH